MTSGARRAGTGLVAVLLLALLPATLAAQVPQPGAGGQPDGPSPVAPEQDPFQGQQTQPAQPPRDPLDPIWSELPRTPFEGFPVFPSRLSGYGNQPLTGAGQLRNVPLLPLAAPEPPGWPGWLRLRDRQALPFAADLALLVRNADRVWWRAESKAAFVPLYFHDKLQTLTRGAEVEVRQAGEFELLLHTSTRLVAQGPTDLQLGELSETGVDLDVRRFTRLRLQVNGRDHVVHLPDGSQLQIDAAPAAGEAEGQVLVLLQRADEPSRYGGRATIYNAGSRVVRWQYAFGVVRLEPGHRLTMLLRPPATRIGADLVEQGGSATVDAGAVRFTGADGAELSWCGARFRVDAGHRVRLDPLQGAPFAPPPVDGRSPATSTQ